MNASSTLGETSIHFFAGTEDEIFQFGRIFEKLFRKGKHVTWDSEKNELSMTCKDFIELCIE